VHETTGGSVTLLRSGMVVTQLLLVVPASSATADRSFSCLRQLKTYLRNTMLQARLNHMVLLNVHQERVGGLRITDIQGSFICSHESRRKLFGCSSNAFSLKSKI